MYRPQNRSALLNLSCSSCYMIPHASSPSGTTVKKMMSRSRACYGHSQPLGGSRSMGSPIKLYTHDCPPPMKPKRNDALPVSHHRRWRQVRNSVMSECESSFETMKSTSYPYQVEPTTATLTQTVYGPDRHSSKASLCVC